MQNEVNTPALSPTAAQIRELRIRTGRTQAQAAAIIGKSERQYQRWEAGKLEMAPLVWTLFKRLCGMRMPPDFTVAQGTTTRSGAPERESRRDSIERGDFVHLQPVTGPMIQARVYIDPVHDGLVDKDRYAGIVIGFPGHPEAGQEFEGWAVGERVWFRARHVIHIEQRKPDTVIGGAPELKGAQ